MVDSEDNIEIPISTTAMAPPNAKLASIIELISIIVFTSFPFCHKKSITSSQVWAYSGDISPV